MMKPQEYQIDETPIRKGVTFLEASAGTGKTYTISRMAVRLIAEEGLPVSALLVMTFTEAATKELKGRIRQAIQETLHQLKNSDTEDPLAKSFRKEPDEQQKVIERRLNLALASFDEAPIFTIHGFCHRILNDFAFESNQLFEPTLLKEPSPLWLEAFQDFWRENYYHGNGFVSSLLSATGITPDSLLHEFRSFIRFPDIHVLPEVSEENLRQSTESLTRIWQELRKVHERDQSDLLEIFSEEAHFKSKLKPSIPFLRLILAADWPATPTADLFTAIKHLARSHLPDQLLQKASVISLGSPLHDLCDEWLEALFQFQHHHQFNCFQAVLTSLKDTKERENLLTFDDLLPGVLNILESGSGNRLQARIQKTFTAALIDEFQDTDPKQTELFRRLFVSPDHYLFLIGDSKQAIYKFRGADIFSYLNARELANELYTLSTNWRSDPQLVEAINGLFSQNKIPFLFDAISFKASSAALEAGAFTYKGESLKTPFSFCYHASENSKSLTNKEARECTRAAMTQEILRILGPDYRIHNKKVRPADIAILTRTKQEAIEVREELSLYGLPSVFSTDQTVFESLEAPRLLHLLRCWLEPHRMEWIRALYASEWFSWDASQIYETNTSSNGWEATQNKTRDLHDIWKADGITPALNEWMSWSKIKSHLLAQPGGERATTNLLHLTELICQTEEENQLTPLALTQWLERTIKDPDKERDDFITRLESDEDAIHIATIHKSKGLQYPIVFAPFTWSSAIRTNEPAIYHRQANQGHLVLDCRETWNEDEEEQYHKECLSDALRLLYVALTRAKHACYLFWGDLKSQENSSIGRLLGLGKDQGPQSPAAALDKLKNLQLPGIQITSTQGMADSPGPDFRRFKGEQTLAAKALERIPENGFSISSFSSLSTGFKEAIEESVPEDEEPVAKFSEEECEDSIFTLPKGSVAGTLIHNILELADLNDPESIQSITEQQVEESALEVKWIPVLIDHILDMLDTPIQAGGETFSLNQLDPASCIAEAEFHFPTRKTPLKSLIRYFKTIAAKRFGSEIPKLESWNEQRLNGFLRGFIDLLFEWNGRFYILDWKSNWLGNELGNYNHEHMDQAMAHNAYFLQYYLYTLATVRYLSFRNSGFDYEKHFGGVFYLFVRGVHPSQPSSGIFFDRPQKADIQTLDSLFAQSK